MDFRTEIAKLITSKYEALTLVEVEELIEVPANPEMGDYAFPCFKLAKVFRKAPNMIANEMASNIELPSFVSKLEAVSAYVNFFIDKTTYVSSILKLVLEQDKDFGYQQVGNGKNIVVDYSSPNIAKPFHVGHLRSTAIGRAICNLYRKLGYNVIGVNHLGDWGTQFGKLIVAYKKWGDKEAIQKGGIQELTRIYVKFHEEAEKDPKLDDEARMWFVKMQDGEEEAISLWKWFYEISIKEFERIYKRLNVSFESYAGESFYNDKMATVVDELKEKNLLQESQGAQIVDLSEFNLNPCLIIRSDGGTLYATRDITAALYRKKTYDFEKCIYLTALDQNLHFAQWFKVIKKMGYSWSENLVHVPFGLVSLETGKLSTRHGVVVLMEDLLNEAVEKTKQIIELKNPNLENKDEVAEQVGIGAVVFNDLYNGRIKDVVFSWEKMLNFDGETGPYVQYTHARANSVIQKAGGEINKNVDFSVLTDASSVEVVKLLGAFPDKIKDAAEKYEPSVLTRYIVDLSQAFNKFYHDNSIITQEQNIRDARLLLVYCVKTVLASGLAILGIKAPQKM